MTVLLAQTLTVGTCVPTVILLDVLQMHSYSEYTSLAQKVQRIPHALQKPSFRGVQPGIRQMRGLSCELPSA